VAASSAAGDEQRGAPARRLIQFWGQLLGASVERVSASERHLRLSRGATSDKNGPQNRVCMCVWERRLASSCFPASSGHFCPTFAREKSSTSAGGPKGAPSRAGASAFVRFCTALHCTALLCCTRTVHSAQCTSATLSQSLAVLVSRTATRTCPALRHSLSAGGQMCALSPETHCRNLAIGSKFIIKLSPSFAKQKAKRKKRPQTYRNSTLVSPCHIFFHPHRAPLHSSAATEQFISAHVWALCVFIGLPVG